MEESLREASATNAWRETFTHTIEQQRQKIGERIATHRERLRELQARIAGHLEETTHDVSKQREQAQKAGAEAEAKAAALLAELKLKEQALAERERQTQKQRRSLAQQIRARKNDVAAEAELNRAQVAAAGNGQDMQLQLRISELQGKYDRLKEEADSRQAQRDEATQRLAELKARAETGEREVSRLQADLDRTRRESQEQIERLRADQGKSVDGQVQSLNHQLDELRKKLAGEESAWQKARQDLEQQLAAARQAGGDKASTEEVKKLRDENKQLETWLAEAEEKAKKAGSGSTEGNQEIDDLKRRFEMAVQDVRELKTKNTELTEQLAKAKSAPAAKSSVTAATGGSWESLKQKLMADLESDFDEKEDAQKADKLTVQGAIKITDQVVAEKETEIQELRKLLEAQSQQVGAVAVGAAAVAEMLDTDELVRQERESLKRLQDGLRDQLKQAEVDISVERAKLARERAELDEKIRVLEAEKASNPVGGSEGGGEKGKKPGGRKWLTRLGLGENKEEK